MTDQTTERTLGDTTPDDGDGSQLANIPGWTDPVSHTVLTLEQILDATTQPEETVWICLDGKLEAEWMAVVDELRGLVDADGNPLPEKVGEEATLADKSRVEHLNAKQVELAKARRAKRTPFKFRGLIEDQYDELLKKHKDGQGRIKDAKKLENELIAACCFSHEITPADVDKLRTKFNRRQIVQLWNGAWNVNNELGFSRGK